MKLFIDEKNLVRNMHVFSYITDEADERVLHLQSNLEHWENLVNTQTSYHQSLLDIYQDQRNRVILLRNTLSMIRSENERLELQISSLNHTETSPQLTDKKLTTNYTFRL